jgi:hypothetical protein
VASDSDASANLLAFKPKLQSRRETGTKRKRFLSGCRETLWGDTPIPVRDPGAKFGVSASLHQTSRCFEIPALRAGR